MASKAALALFVTLFLALVIGNNAQWTLVGDASISDDAGSYEYTISRPSADSASAAVVAFSTTPVTARSDTTDGELISRVSQTFSTEFATDVESFTVDSRTYMAVCNAQSNTVDIYLTDGAQFQLVQSLAARTPASSSHFVHNGRAYLAVANSEDRNAAGGATISTDSDIFVLNSLTGQFELFQSLPTSAATRLRPFTLNIDGTEHTALVALNFRYFDTDLDTLETDSHVYLWNAATANFSLLQSITTFGAVDAEAFTDAFGITRLVLINAAYEETKFGVRTSPFTYSVSSRVYRYKPSFDPSFEEGPFVRESNLATVGASDAEIFSPDGGTTILMAIVNRRTAVLSNVESRVNIYRWRSSVSQFASVSSFDETSITSVASFVRGGILYLAVASNMTSTGQASSNSFVYQYFAPDTSFFLRLNQSTVAAQDLEPIDVDGRLYLASASSQPAGPIIDIETAGPSTSVVWRLFLAGPDTDFAATNGMLYFAASETSKTVTVPVVASTEAEADEIFSVGFTHSAFATAGALDVTILGDTPVEVVISPSRVAISGEPNPPVQIANVTVSGVPGASQSDLSFVEGNEANVFTFNGLDIITQQVLDRESVESGQYTLLVRYQDPTDINIFGLAWVIIDVLDLNDNAPFFEGDIDNGNNFLRGVLENQPVGTVLMQLQAQDADTVVNVVYSIDRIEDATGYTGPSPAFAINGTTGIITTLATFDREVLSNDFIIYVRATDRDKPSDVAEAFIVVPILDVNDFVPNFLDSDSINATVPEHPDTSIGEVVISNIRVADYDDDDNAVIDVTIIAGDELNNFAVERVSSGGGITVFEVSVRTILDYEDVNDRSFDLTLQACDRGVDGRRCSTALALIRVTDINDNSPIFGAVTLGAETDFAFGHYRLLEDVSLGVVAVDVTATDRDSGNNAVITYSFSTSSAKFGIDSASGAISVETAGNAGTSTLSVTASDAGVPQRTASTDLLMAVLDRPTFNQASYSIDVPENTAGAIGLDVTASVAVLSSSATLAYSIVGGNSLGKFAIGAASGALSVANMQHLDHEGTDPLSYTLTVLVRDTSTSLDRSTTVDVSISVTDVNDVAPEFIPSSHALNPVTEDDAVETFVTRDLVTLPVVDPDTVGTQTFTIVSAIGFLAVTDEPVVADTSLFSVDGSGTLRTAARLDAEVYGRLTVTVGVSDGVASDSAIVTFDLTNVNDVAPTFVSASFFGSARENTTVGAAVLTTAAMDNDVVPDPIVYRLEASPLATSGDGSFDKFSVSTTGVISVAAPLDFESVTRHVFRVVVSDGEFEASAEVEIALSNINEHTPVFDASSLGNVTVSEDAPAGTSVTTVAATDDDADDVITFSLVGSASALTAFTIDNATGAITTTATLDRETTSVYGLTVAARDTGGRTAYATVVVAIGDVNDNAPVFSASSYAASVREDLATGSTVVTVEALDADAGTNGAVTYSLGGTDAALFSIDTDEGTVSVAVALDREAASSLALTVTATDGGGMASTVAVTVNLADVNDEAPVFPNSSVTITVSEDTPVNTVVYTAGATDADVTSPNNVVVYALTSGGGGAFSVDSAGQVIVAANLDYDVRGSMPFTLTITATDQGNEVQNMANPSLTLSIVLSDVNDNSPVFDRSAPLAASVDEGVAGAVVFTATATDADEIETLVWQIDTVVPTTSAFLVDSATGTVTTAASPLLDRETVDSYSVTLTVTDAAGATDTATWTVTISDVNDNAPTFTNAPYVASVPETAPLNTIVVTVRASDLDDPSTPGGTIAGFTLISDSSNGLFGLNTATGAIFTQSTNLDAEAGEVYRVVVEVADGGGLTKQTTVSIQIQDKNDEAPIFTQAVYTAAPVSEAASLGTQVIMVKAEDADISPENNAVTYAITSDPTGYFAIDGSGRITVNAVMDREAFPSEITLTVRASDIDDLADTADVLITLADVNDNAPTFPSSALSFDVAEDTSVGTVVFTLSAEDRDIGVNAEIEYTLSGDPAPFQVDLTSGDVTLVAAVDRETVDTYTLTATASNPAGGVADAVATLTITVTDVNDNFPVFGGNATSEVSESAPPGVVLFTVIVSDADEGSNAVVTLQLDLVEARNVSSASWMTAPGLVLLDTASGVVTLGAAVDREAISAIWVTVTATDGGGQSTQFRYTVFVRDVNDNAPVFTAGTYNFNIAEAEPQGSRVGQVEAVDADQGALGQVTYSLLPSTGSTKFVIDADTGIIRTAVILDFDLGATMYELTVRAADGGSPALFTDRIVTVQVLDVNDNTPEFSLSTYLLNLRENTDGPTTLSVNATDADSVATGFGVVTYSIAGGPDAAAFSVDATSGLLSVILSFDRETQDSYSVTVRATDSNGGAGALSANAVVTGSIIDVNDNMPVLAEDSVTVTVEENGNTPRFVARVNASDADTSANAALTYTLTSWTTLFAVDASGIISLIAPLDFEVRTMYTVLVTVADNTNATANAIFTLTVNVGDVNDNSPIFDPRVYTHTLTEDDPAPSSGYTSAGAAIVDVLATDADESGTAAIVYTLFADAALQDTSTYFVVDSTTGSVTRTAVLIDREAVETLNAFIVATDAGGNMDVAELTVTVQDRNDNEPVFEQAAYEVTVSENVAVGHVIITLLATDADAAEFGSIEGYIGTFSDGRFSIDANTGEVSVARALDFENATTIDVTYTVTAVDGGMPAAEGSATLRILLQDENDNSPIFDAGFYMSNIVEHAAVGTEVIRVTATDDDAGFNGEITYSVVAEDSRLLLAVDANGIVTIAGGSDILDRDGGQTVYAATVTATDGPGRNVSVRLEIALVDINDNAPVYSSGDVMPLVAEDASLGTVVATFTFTDSDAGLNADLVYSLVEDDAADPGRFAVDSTTGNLTLITSLDHETTTTYTLRVGATDQVGAGNSASVEVIVRVVDINDNAPVFDPFKLVGSVNEEEGAQGVLRVQATDEDSFSFGTVVAYHLLTMDQPFALDSVTGLLRTTGPVDRETTERFLLEVQAVDGGGRTTNATVTVLVNDVNDNAPTFACDFAGATIVSPFAVQGDVVTTLTAMDADPDANLRYKMKEGCGGIFGIVPGDGRLFVRHALDPESTILHNVVVQVSDGRFTAETTIILLVDTGEVYRTNRKLNSLIREVGSMLADDLPEEVVYEALLEVPTTAATSAPPPFTQATSTVPPVSFIPTASTSMPNFTPGPGSSSTPAGGQSTTAFLSTTSTTTSTSINLVTTAPVLAQVTTTGGNANGGACVFPFEYKGVVYNGCTTVDNRGLYWCSLDAVFDPASGTWGNCVIEEYFTIAAPTGALQLYSGRGTTQPIDMANLTRGNTYAFETTADTAGLPTLVTNQLDAPAGAALQGNAVQNSGAEAGQTLFFTLPDVGPITYWLGEDGSSFARLSVLNASSTTTVAPVFGADDVLTLENTGNPENSPVRACHFPFTYMGVEYTSCTCAVISSYWCSTTANFDLNQEYGLCDTTTFNTSQVECSAGSFALRVQHPTSPLDAYARTDESSDSAGGSASSVALVAGLTFGVVFALLAAAVAVVVRSRRAAKVELLPRDASSAPPKSTPAFAPAHSRAGVAEHATYRPNLTETPI